jgi:hypothetical protein
MANDERDANHIWLRQSVRFTQDGRERTIEIALPLPIGATPQEVERLLGEADAGMARLGQHLDRQVAAALGGSAVTPVTAPATTPAPTDAPPPTPSRASASPAPSQPAPTPSPPPSARAPAAGRIAEPPITPARPTPSTSVPAPITAASVRAPLSPRGEGRGGEAPLTRPEFLAETRALGLTPPQVMERLGVRSLDGLNLREALEMLRRQLGNGASATPEPGTPRATPAGANDAAPASARAEVLAPATPPVFDEEEEFELVVLGPDMPPEEYGEELPYGDEATPEPADALDALDDDGEDGDEDALDEVPDLGPMLPPSPEPARAGGFTPAQKARAREMVAVFRAVAAGGSAVRSQHTAFTNVVADQLSAATAETLVRGLWGQPPERLGTDQLNAVIRWGKQDEFAEEAPVVLALLRAEQAHKSSASGVAAAPVEPGGEAEAPPPRRAARKSSGSGGRS